MDKTISWFAMPVWVKISNVGSEVHRAIRWKNRGDVQKKEFLELMKKDPKNRYRTGELDCCIDELQDYLMGENSYNTSEEQLIKYYDAFL